MEPTFKTHMRQAAADLLQPLLGRKAVLWDVPFHSNIGDTLIWQGELDLLRSLGVKLTGCDSFETCRFPRLDRDTTVILHGGGNFGTLYPEYGRFRAEVLRRYPDNRVVLMPQSVWYDDSEAGRETLRRDVEAFAAHPDATLCARDAVSADFMARHFGSSRVRLVPDMAFCIDDSRLAPFRRRKPVKDTLCIMRADSEITEAGRLVAGCGPDDVRDWYDRPTRAIRTAERLRWLKWRLSYTRFADRMPGRVANAMLRTWYCRRMRPEALAWGASLTADYRRVVSTRLHGMILAAMLGRDVEYIDNSTGKISAYVDTWLSDYPEIFKPYTG